MAPRYIKVYELVRRSDKEKQMYHIFFPRSPVTVVVCYCTLVSVTIIRLATDAVCFDIDELFGTNQFGNVVSATSPTEESGAIVVLLRSRYSSHTDCQGSKSDANHHDDFALFEGEKDYDCDSVAASVTCTSNIMI